MSREQFKPLSLAQHFEPPQGYVGRFGWICGYTADVAFINDAAERFAGATNFRRAYAGDIVLALILDPGNEQLPLELVPGAFHLPFANVAARPFRLMHAKLALLGYRAENDERWLLRLLVGTGNWTRETLEQNLDLVWRLEVRVEELHGRPDPLVRQACADVRAAWSLFEFLRGQYDGNVLAANRQDGRAAPWQARLADMDQWITQTSAQVGKSRPRFFDNRARSLLEQLPEQIPSKTRRNYLAMGSGFFESVKNRQSAPAVLEKIVSSLQKEELLTAGDPEIDVFVNPDACQAIANSLPWMSDMGWTVRRPGRPKYLGEEPRSLHAKFLFSANCGKRSNNCNSPWVYLGSGNLTGPGFDNQMSANGGNLEAGVVFEPGELYWHGGRNYRDQNVVTNLLPIRWEDGSAMNDPSELKPGRDMEEPTAQFVAPPIAWVWWIDGWLRPSNENASEFAILDNSGEPCERDERHFFRWPAPEEQPPQVRVHWNYDGNYREALVPVVDQHGRIAAKPLPQLEIADAWNELASFPMPPDEEEIPEDPQESSSALGVGPARGAGKAKYPIRCMMELIENIGEKQSSLLKFDWSTWCARLEQCLGQTADSVTVKQFHELGLNPLSPLWHAPFRPAFAAASASPEGERYESALRRIEEQWHVADLPRIGGNHEPGVPGLEASRHVVEPAGE